jgi:hypothetical protein
MLCTQEELPTPCLINQELLKAARDGDLVMLKVSIAQGGFLETRRPIAIGLQEVADQYHQAVQKKKVLPGLTPLMHAARGAHLKCVNYLLSAQANVNAEDEDCMTPLHFAAQCGDYDIGAALVRAGAAKNALDDDGMVPLEHLPDEVHQNAIEKKRWTQLLTLAEATKTSSCSRHRFECVKIPNNTEEFCCSCSELIQAGDLALSCVTCGRIVCQECARKGELNNVTKCSRGHNLQKTVANFNMCDGCGREGVAPPECVYRCERCDVDLCQSCYSQAEADIAPMLGKDKERRPAGVERLWAQHLNRSDEHIVR